jgi:HK97 gp10 family phage protein
MEIDKLPNEIEKAVASYTKEVEAAIEKELDVTADKIIDYIKSNAPRGWSTKHLADSFVKKSYSEGSNKIIVIYSATKSGLVHLVELGFKHRSGKMVAARPYLRPAYENLTPQMVDEIKTIIENGGAT